MKCPYCAESIQEHAIVCRYCGRDFQRFIPLLRKVIEVEKRLSALEGGRQHESAPKPSGDGPGGGPGSGPVFFKEAALFALVAGGVRSLVYLLGVPLPVHLMLSFGAPALLGSLFGYAWGNRNLFPLALVVCLIAIALLPIHAELQASGARVLIYAPSFLWRHPFLLVSAFGAAIILISFVFVGHRLFRHALPEVSRPGLAGRLAQSLARQSTDSYDERMQHMAAIKATLIAYSPLISLIGTVVGAVLASLGAVYGQANESPK